MKFYNISQAAIIRRPIQTEKQKQPARNRAVPELKQNKKPERSGRPLRLRPPRSVNGQETETAAIRHTSRNISVSTHAPARDAAKNRKSEKGRGDCGLLGRLDFYF